MVLVTVIEGMNITCIVLIYMESGLKSLVHAAKMLMHECMCVQVNYDYNLHNVWSLWIFLVLFSLLRVIKLFWFWDPDAILLFACLFIK